MSGSARIKCLALSTAAVTAGAFMTLLIYNIPSDWVWPVDARTKAVRADRSVAISVGLALATAVIVGSGALAAAGVERT